MVVTEAVDIGVEEPVIDKVADTKCAYHLGHTAEVEVLEVNTRSCWFLMLPLVEFCTPIGLLV